MDYYDGVNERENAYNSSIYHNGNSQNNARKQMCFYHDGETAVAQCEKCGRSLCKDCAESYRVVGGEYAGKKLCYNCCEEIVRDNVNFLEANKKKIILTYIFTVIGAIAGGIIGSSLSDDSIMILIFICIGASFISFVKDFITSVGQAFKVMGMGEGAGGELLGLFFFLFKIVYIMLKSIVVAIVNIFKNTIDLVNASKAIKSDNEYLQKIKDHMEYTKVDFANKGLDSNPLTMQNNQPVNNTQSTPADVLYSSPNCHKYEDLISYLKVCGKNASALAYDALLWSMNNGSKIEQFAVTDSLNEGFPYFCVTESEYDQFRYIIDPLKKGEQIDNILHMCGTILRMEDNDNPYKLRFWKEKLLDYIAEGDIEVQSAIIGVKNSTRLWKDKLFSESEINEIVDKYEMKIRNAAQSGELVSLMYVAVYMTRSNTFEELDNVISMLEESTESNLSDAWYWLSKKIIQKRSIFVMNGDRFETVKLSPEEEEEVFRKYYTYRLKGADVNKGQTAACLQIHAGELYGYGDAEKYGIKKDYDKAVYYFRMAEKNGIKIDNYLSTLNSSWSRNTNK